MFDQNWDLVNGADAHEIEVLNQANQVNVIEALFYLFRHSATNASSNISTMMPNASVVRELHRTGTLFLLAQPGEYRECPVNLSNGQVVVYLPPHHNQVPDLVDSFITDLHAKWQAASAVEIASLCLWRLNWIHPFKNGNGRTARAMAYACLSLKLGFVLPGTPTVIDLIMQNKPEFEAALRHADISFSDAGAADLSVMNDFVERLLVQQLSSVPILPVAH